MIDARISKARTRLLLNAPWFGSLAMRLAIEPETTIETFDVDGTRIRYNPVFADTLTDAELEAVLAHEVMHCALLHPYRRASRDAKQWNEACDYAINGELLKCGFTLPQGALVDSNYDGLASETIYARLGKKPQSQNGQNGQGQGAGNSQPQPNPTGNVMDAQQPGNGQGAGDGTQPQPGNNPASGQPQPMTASDWQIATQQATAVCKMAGKVPGTVAETVRASQTTPADWRAILREFLEHTVPSDYSWMAPNRRYISQGIYLPGVVKENFGTLAIAVDTSGSIDSRLLAVFSTEINAVVSEMKPEKIVVMYCDTHVNRIDEFAGDDPIEMTATGRGGTRFNPVFDRVAEIGESPACLIYFTDLENPASEILTEPDYPVLWATSQAVTREGTFGRTVRVSVHD